MPHSGCPHQCAFCNQHSITGVNSQIPNADEVRSICRQALAEVKEKSNCEIAFFGGSFTAISRDDMLRLLDTANEFIGKDKFSGIRISTRPDCIYPEILDILKKYNVKAIELGAQSMDDTVLTLNERGHTAADIISAAQLIKSYGFSLGLQMMTGLYGASIRSDYEAARKIAEIKPDTVRIYPTVILEDTRLAYYLKKGMYESHSFEETVELCADLLDMFTEKEIAVIKLGLHASDIVEGRMLGGVYHPAFRELCEGRLFRKRIENLLKTTDKNDIIVYVAKGRLSQAIGQKKCNREYLEQKGYRVRFKENEVLKGYEIKIEEETVCI